MIQPVFEELGTSKTDQGLIAIPLGLENLFGINYGNSLRLTESYGHS